MDLLWLAVGVRVSFYPYAYGRRRFGVVTKVNKKSCWIRHNLLGKEINQRVLLIYVYKAPPRTAWDRILAE
jgi:hypothetical protein